MAESVIQVPIWDITLSRTLAFADIEPKIIDYAIDIGTSSALDEYGVSFDLFTSEGFTEYFGVDPQPRPAMEPCTGHGAEIATWNSLNQLTIQQKGKRVLLKASLCSLVPRELLTSMEDDQGSLRSRSSQFIFSALKAQLGVLTTADFDVLHVRLKRPYDRSLPVESFVAAFQATLRTLNRAQQPISNNMAIGYLQGNFSPDWAQCWVKFSQDTPIVAQRTVANLCRAIVIFSRDALPLLSAQQTIGIRLAQEQTAEMAMLRLQVAELTTLMVSMNPIATKINKITLRHSKKKKQKKSKNKLKTKRVVQDTVTLPLDYVNSSGDRTFGRANIVNNNNNNTPVLAISDTGATGTYLQTADMCALQDVKISAASEQVVVAVANGTLLTSTHHGHLNIPGHGTILAHVFPQLKGSLLSVSQLVDLNLRVTYCSKWVKVLNSINDVIFTGHRDVRSGLWMVDLLSLPIVQETINAASAAIRLDSVSDFVNFWHAAYGSPAASTFVAAIDKGYIRVPGLTSVKVRRHLPNTVATAHGHLTATRKGIQSTKPKPNSLDYEPAHSEDDSQDTIDTMCPAEKRLWVRVDDVKSGRTHADATGPLPLRARNNALYQIIFYNEDANYIHIETTTSRGGSDLLAALQRAVDFFRKRGMSVQLIRMDNECAKITKDWIDNETMTLELTPVASHRTNKAERAIRTWKDHFIATLATTDPECPLFLWDDFKEQSEFTLNSMRTSRVHPLLSAWEALCGKFDIMATPIAPLGMKVMVHDTPEKRGTWQVHGSVGFYIGRALLHYRCHNVWMKETRATRISNCLAWFPKLLKMPGSSQIEELTAAVTDVRNLLKNLAGTPSRNLQPDVDSAISEQLRDVRALFSPPIAGSSNDAFWPRGQEVLQLNPTPIRIADALPDTNPAIPQRVPIAQSQRVPTVQPQRVPTGQLQRVPAVQPQRVPTDQHQRVPTAHTNAPTSITLPLQVNQQVRPPTKPRNRHQYFDLSDAEVNKLPKITFNHIGKQFVDDEDPFDTATGVITNIVRHKKSRKLAFKYWNHQLHDREPSSPADFDYIDVKYAMSKCKWLKYKPRAAFIAASVTPEDTHCNAGIFRNSKTKARQRQRYVPWWHQRSNSINSAVAKLRATMHTDFNSYASSYNCYAFTALDLNSDGSRLTSASALKGPDKDLWDKAHGEEIIRLIESQTGRFIHRSEMPTGRKAAYYNPQLKIKVKSDGTIYRVRGTIGGDQIIYPGVTTAYTAHLETIRILLNAVVSENALFMTADIKDFYLGTPLPTVEYMRISLKHIPLDVQQRYNIAGMVHNGYVLMEISKGIYGLPQAGKLAQDRLVAHLANNGYIQCVNTPCLFVHQSNGVAFTLVVDDFLIKYNDRKEVDHLLSVLRELYTITTEFGATQKYVGITLHHNRTKRHIDMSIPGYVQKAIQRFQRTNLKGADSPIIYVPPNYGKHQQEVPLDEPSVPLTAAEILELQEIVGVFLFYARAVDPTMLTAINKIASRQAKPTSLIKKEVERFLQYANKWPDATMRVRASNMKLVCHSDGSYLSESEARSRAGGILFLGDCKDNEAPNAPICFLSVIIKTVVSSATATEYAAAFIVAQAAISIINTLADLGYPQKETEIFCDNLCAVGLANNNFTLKRTKTIDMRYHWIRDQVKLGTFKVTWKAGKLNLADFFTKAHPVKHHLQIRWKYLHMTEDAIGISRSEGVLIDQ